jgi:hypothetical protein
LGTIYFFWRDCVNSLNLVTYNIACNVVQIRTSYLPNVSRKRCSLNQLSPFSYNVCYQLKNKNAQTTRNAVILWRWRCIILHKSLPLSIPPLHYISVNINCHTKLPSKSRSPKRSFLFKFVSQNIILFHSATCSASLIQFDINTFFLSTKNHPHHFVSENCNSGSSLAQSHKVPVQIYYTSTL